MALKETFNWKSPKVMPKEHPIYPWIILANICLVTFLAIISSIATGIADPSISGELIIDTSSSKWISIAYLMAVGTTLPVSGWLAERRGYKFAFFLGVTLFIIGSGLAGFSFNFSSLLTFRVIEGIGAGLVFPISLTITAKVFPKNMLSLAVSIYMAFGFGMGLTCGFLLGGYCAEFIGWRWIFFSNIFLGVPSLFITWILQQETEGKVMPSFDFLGYAVFIIFLVSILVVISTVKEPWNTKGWTSNLILTCISLSVVGFAVLIYIESHVKNPVVYLGLFKDTPFTLSCIALAIIGMVLFATSNLFPGYLEGYLGYSKFTAALYLAPFGLAMGFVGAFSGVMTRYINIKLLSIIGLLLLASSCFVNANWSIYSDHYKLETILILRAIGIGIAIGPVTSLGLENVPKEIIGQGTSMITFARQMGGAFGSSIMGLIVVYRQAFHNLTYGEQVNIHSTAFMQIERGIQLHLTSGKGLPSADAMHASKILIAKNILAQSYLSSLNDSYLIVGWVTLIITCLIAAVMIRNTLKARKAKALAS